MSHTPDNTDAANAANHDSAPNSKQADAAAADQEQDPIQARMDHLLDQCVQKAIALIQEHGEYYPFGVTLDDQGELSLTQAKVDSETPTSDEVTQKLMRGLMTEASLGRYTSVAIVADVRLRQPGTGLYTDAIRVLMEDRESDPIDFFLPYTREGKKIVTSDLVAQQTQSVIFAK